jgi:Ca2+-transporting ATPase
MITGDYPVTARAIAKQAGIDAGEVMTGDELKELSDEDLQARVKHCSIFARTVPQQKLRIVNAFKANGEVVAMTGDGVNDAPSLKAAHIGIAMGGRGTDVAREASSIVLLDDSFASIVQSVRMGRRIYDNLQKAIGFIFSVHVPIAGLAVLPLLLGLPIILWPIHIALLELVIDPVCSLAFEAEEEEGDLMQRPPRPPEAKLSPLPLIAWNMAQGAIAFGLVAFIAVLAHRNGLPEDELRALTFFALVLCIVGLIFGQRNHSTSVFVSLSRPNRMLKAVLLVTAFLLSAILLVPSLADLFRFGPLHLHDLALTMGAGFVTLLVMDFLKHWRLKTIGRQGLPPAPNGP